MLRLIEFPIQFCIHNSQTPLLYAQWFPPPSAAVCPLLLLHFSRLEIVFKSTNTDYTPPKLLFFSIITHTMLYYLGLNVTSVVVSMAVTRLIITARSLCPILPNFSCWGCACQSPPQMTIASVWIHVSISKDDIGDFCLLIFFPSLDISLLALISTSDLLCAIIILLFALN